MKNALVLNPDRDGKIELRGSVAEGSLRTIVRMLDADLVNSESFMGGLAIFQPGAKVAPHVHGDAEEINVVLAGEGYFLTAQGAKPIKAGDWQFIPKGVPHAHENSGDVPLTILWLYSPPSTTIPK